MRELHLSIFSQDFSLCDVADGRMLDWLEDVVEEEDFRRMEEFGVEVVRVPTGYWNWIQLGNLTPNAPPEVAERFRNLQIVTARQYEKYIDRQTRPLQAQDSDQSGPISLVEQFRGSSLIGRELR